jgi:hypothetical protein
MQKTEKEGASLSSKQPGVVKKLDGDDDSLLSFLVMFSSNGDLPVLEVSWYRTMVMQILQ